MQYADDADLAEALAASTRRVSVLLEFDWKHDGTYAHPYSDLSALCQAVSSDRQITGDLPERVNTLTGYSSAELRATLAGNRDSAELSAVELLSPFNRDSPLYGYRLPGTPVRQSRVVHTRAGPRVIRQFTGWVRSFKTSRVSGEVNLVASDIEDINAKRVTLPRWAIVPPTYESAPTNGQYSPSLQGLLSWAAEEVLRQAGRPSGPAARDDAAAYVSCNGMLLPSIGSFVGSQRTLEFNHSLSFAADPPWVLGPYGYAPGLNPDGPVASDKLAKTLFSTNRVVSLPNDGSSDKPQTIGISLWAYSDGSTTEYNEAPFVQTKLYLQDVDNRSIDSLASNGNLNLTVYRNGAASIYLQESTYQDNNELRYWNYDTPLAQGWHYLCGIVRATSSSITASLLVDDTPVEPTGTRPATRGYRYLSPLMAERTNQVEIFVDIPAQHIQVFAGPSATTDYVVGQQHPPTRDGRPLSYVLHPYSELHWTPDVYEQNAWDVLKEIAGSEFGVVHTNEYGQVIYASHPAVRTVTDLDLAEAITITEDHTLDFVINPTSDGYANAVSLSSTVCTQVRETVWTNEGPLDYYAEPGRTYSTSASLDGAIGVITYFVAVSATPPSAGTSLTESTASAIRADDLSLQAPASGWGFSALPSQDGRNIHVFWWAIGSPYPLYIGSYIGGQQASINITGRKYSQRAIQRFAVRDDVEVELRGERVLILADNDWRQGQFTIDAIGRDLLRDTVNPSPVVEDISIPSDPRLQLRDVVRLTNESGTTGTLFAQVIGIAREDSGDAGSRDRLAVRIVRTPGIALWDEPTLGWNVGTWGE